MPTRKQKLASPVQNKLLAPIGAWNDLPHYAIIGDPCSFYLWKHEAGDRGDNTEWISGREANEVLALLRAKRIEGKPQFIEAFMQIYTKHSKRK